MNGANRFEYTTEQDIFFDYCLHKYTPVVPAVDKFRSVNLLYHSFEVLQADERAFDLVEHFRNIVGPFHTVWGVQKSGARIGWEFYFYDYRRENRQRSITKIMDGIRPYLACNVKANENQPYFMFSVDIDRDVLSGTKKNLDEIHMYIGNTASQFSSGISYSVTHRGAVLENFYFFFDPQKHENELMEKVFCSAQVDPANVFPDEILWPELRKCKTICVANKPRHDCIYFCGIDLDQFCYFLKRLEYPLEIISFMEENRSQLDHLQYDVGIDYRMEGDELQMMKSGYYGNF